MVFWYNIGSKNELKGIEKWKKKVIWDVKKARVVIGIM